MAIKNSWASGEVLLAADLTDSMKGVFVNPQTGTSYTFGTADGFVTLSNASGGTATIPANATAAFNVGAVVGVMNAGTAGSFTIGTAAGVTLNAVSGATTLAPLEAATLVKLATNTWQVAKAETAVASQGLTLITTQSFSAASAVNVNNCFSATYSNYLIIFSCYGSTTAANVLARLGASASFDSASNYSYAYENPQRGGTTGVVAGNATTSWQLSDAVTTSSTQYLSTTLVISNPFLANSTNYTLNSWSRQVMKALPGGGTHELTTSYTDIQLLASTGTITGTISLYGYRN